eukprot:scaffold5423_cov133-Isochrysis_galbana.AAC.2
MSCSAWPAPASRRAGVRSRSSRAGSRSAGSTRPTAASAPARERRLVRRQGPSETSGPHRLASSARQLSHRWRHPCRRPWRPRHGRARPLQWRDPPTPPCRYRASRGAARHARGRRAGRRAQRRCRAPCPSRDPCSMPSTTAARWRAAAARPGGRDQSLRAVSPPTCRRHRRRGAGRERMLRSPATPAPERVAAWTPAAPVTVRRRSSNREQQPHRLGRHSMARWRPARAHGCASQTAGYTAGSNLAGQVRSVGAPVLTDSSHSHSSPPQLVGPR